MALNRKQLKEKLVEAGVDEARVAQLVEFVIAGHTDTIDALKEERDQAKGEAAKIAEVQAALDKANGRIAELEKRPGAEDLDALKKALADEQAKGKKALDEYKQQVETENSNRAKMSAVETALKAAGANEQAVKLMLKGVDLTGVEMENGALKDAQKVVEPYKTEYSGFFGEVKTQGVPIIAPPGGGKLDVSKMNDEEYFAYIRESGKK